MQLDPTKVIQETSSIANENQEERCSSILEELKQRNQQNREIIKKYIKQLKKKYMKQKLRTEPVNDNENGQKETFKIYEKSEREEKRVNNNIFLPKKRSSTIQKQPCCRNINIHHPKLANPASASKISSLPLISFPNCLFAIQTALQVLEPRQNESTSTSKSKKITNNIRDYLLKQAKIRQAEKSLCREGSPPQNSNHNKFSDDKIKTQHSGIKQLSFELFKEISSLKPEGYKSQIESKQQIRKDISQIKSKGRLQTNEGSLLFKINKHSFPNINKSHLQRNKKCLQIFLKCSKSNQFEKNQFVNLLKNENYYKHKEIMNLKENHSKANTLPIRKQP